MGNPEHVEAGDGDTAFGSGSSRPFHVAPWQWTLACGAIKLLIALTAFALPLLTDRPLPSSVGWMLVIGGATELALAWRGRDSWVGRLTFASGVVTVIAGALFVRSPWTGLFPLAQFMMIWLVLRGLVSFDIAIQSRLTPQANWVWLLLRGATDLGLGLLLLMGAPLAMFTVVLFGETAELITSFFHLIGLSFLVGGAGLVSISLAQRRRHLNDPFLTGR